MPESPANIQAANMRSNLPALRIVWADLRKQGFDFQFPMCRTWKRTPGLYSIAAAAEVAFTDFTNEEAKRS